MNKIKLISSILIIFSLVGCATKDPEKPTPITQTRDQVLNPEKYYIPIGLDTELKLFDDNMKIIDVMKQIESQSAYTYQIYDINEVGHYKVEFPNRKMSSIEILKVIDSQYSEKLNIIVDEESRYITIKKIN